MSLKELKIVGVPDKLVIGIYKIDGKPDKLPPRMRRMHPKMLVSFQKLQTETPGIVVSDIFRSPESSLQASNEKRGVLKPSYSGHGYGLAFDLDVSKTLKRLGFKKKKDLDAFLKTFNFYCHRRDGSPGFEEWHFDYNLDGVLVDSFKKGERSNQPARERMLKHFYGSSFVLEPKDIQEALKALGFYGGAIDGLLGKLSKFGLMAFQRAWELSETGKADAKTQRVLWFVYACKILPLVTV